MKAIAIKLPNLRASVPAYVDDEDYMELSKVLAVDGEFFNND